MGIQTSQTQTDRGLNVSGRNFSKLQKTIYCMESMRCRKYAEFNFIVHCRNSETKLFGVIPSEFTVTKTIGMRKNSI